MNPSPVYLFARWQVKEGEVENVLHLLSQAAIDSRKEPGNIFYKIHQAAADPKSITLYESYADESALEAHRNSPHFKTIVLQQIVPLLDNRESVVTSLLEI